MEVNITCYSYLIHEIFAALPKTF